MRTETKKKKKKKPTQKPEVPQEMTEFEFKSLFKIYTFISYVILSHSQPLKF